MIDDLLGIFRFAFDGNPFAIAVVLVGVTAVVGSVALVVLGQRRRK